MEILKDTIPNHVFQRLQAAGIDSSDYFLLESKQEICDKTKLSKRDVNNLIHFISKLNLNKTFLTALDLKTNKGNSFISMGCPKLDEAIKGIPGSGITEIFGESGVGKTQINLQLLLNVDRNNDKGGSIYICTEGAFPSKRLEELLSAYSSEGKKNIMDNIYIEHIHELDQLKKCIDIKIPVLVSRTKINLIIIDSITSIFRYDNELNDYITRTEDLRYITTKLNKISVDYNIAIVCVNQVTADPNIGLKPCLGLSWSNLIRKRIQLTRTNSLILFNNENLILRKMKVIFAPDVARNEISYIIEKEGVKGL